MSAITNVTDISLPLAVWVLNDDYDYNTEENYISVTSLMKPLRQIILGAREKTQQVKPDVADFIATSLGSSLHASIERAWSPGRFEKPLRLLGYPESVISSIRINPKVEEEGTIPIYMEQRVVREIMGYKVGGKFDLIADGILMDNKSTSTYAWTAANRDDDYCLQGSIYRWLNSEKVKSDYIRINFIFTDWQSFRAKADPNYPQSRLAYKDIPLMSLEDTEIWVRNKLQQLKKYWNAPEKDIPECTDAELWKSPDSYRYYADPTKTSGRSTKNFNSKYEADMHKMAAGKGVVIVKPGTVKRCSYCSAFEICSQQLRYSHD